MHVITSSGTGLNKRNEIYVAPVLMRLAEQKFSVGQRKGAKTDMNGAEHLKLMEDKENKCLPRKLCTVPSDTLPPKVASFENFLI